jgi:hypothetical protein
MTNKSQLLDQVRDKPRLKHYRYGTEQSDIAWIKRFIFFYNEQHPDTMGERKVESFLIYLAVKRNVAASAQNQALCVLLFYIRRYQAVNTHKVLHCHPKDKAYPYSYCLKILPFLPEHYLAAPL